MNGAKKRLYISGAITNNPNYQAQFAAAEIKMKEEGYQVINPALLGIVMPKNINYEEWMQIDLLLLDMCDTIYMLRGWEDSRGANREMGFALGKGKTIIFE